MDRTKVAKLIYVSEEQSKLLDELKNEIIDQGGFTTVSQLLRDSVEIMLQGYRNEILWRYSPIKIEKRSQRVV